LNKSVKVADICGISAAVQYDFDLTQLNGTAIGTLDECTENYLPLTPSKVFKNKKLGTGDRFNDSKTDYELLTSTLSADIRDMECGAIVQACMHAGIKCRSYKIISDIAGSGSTTDQYLSNLTKCFAALSKDLEILVKEIYG
jgi:nucleoside phosphorylase